MPVTPGPIGVVVASPGGSPVLEATTGGAFRGPVTFSLQLTGISYPPLESPHRSLESGKRMDARAGRDAEGYRDIGRRDLGATD